MMSFHGHFWECPQKVNMCPSPHPFFSDPFCILTLEYDGTTLDCQLRACTEDQHEEYIPGCSGAPEQL